MLGFLRLSLTLLPVAVRDRGDLVAENVLLRQQLAVLTRATGPRPRFRTRDKLFWVLIRAVWRDWRRHLLLVRPATVVGWRRQGWALFRGGRSRGRPGRPRLDAEVRELIARMARENPTWGSERIRGELLKLGIAVSKRSIQRYRQRGPARPPDQTWRTFLANHVGQLRAAGPSTVADADRLADLHAAVQATPVAPGPASARDHEPACPDPAATDRSDATGPGAAHPERPSQPDLHQRAQRSGRVGWPRGPSTAGARTRCGCQPPASDRAPAAGVPGLPAHGRRPGRAAAARRARRVLRRRAPPSHAPPGASQAAGRLPTGPVRARPVVGGLHHAPERAA